MLVVGGMSGNDTLNPITYTENPQRVVVVVLRGIFICFSLLILPASTFYISYDGSTMVTHALISAGISSPSIVANIATYLHYFGMFLPLLVLYEAGKRFLISQGVIYPIFASGCGGVLTHWLLLRYWVDAVGVEDELGGTGTIRKVAIAHGLQPVVVGYFVIMYCVIFKPHDPRTVPASMPEWGDIFEWKTLRKHLSLSLAGILSLSEWLYWEIQTFLISSLNNTLYMTAQAVVQSMVPLFYMAPLGLSIGAGVLVGNNIGTGDVKTVSKAVNLVAKVGLGLGCVMGLICFVFRSSIVATFTNDGEVKGILEGMWVGVTVFVVMDQVFCVQAKILTSLGMQATLSKLILFCLYGIGVPLIYFHGIKNSGGIGEVWGVAWVPYGLLNLGMWWVRRKVNFANVVAELREGGGKGEYEAVGEGTESSEEEEEEEWADADDGGWQGDFQDEDKEVEMMDRL